MDLDDRGVDIFGPEVLPADCDGYSARKWAVDRQDRTLHGAVVRKPGFAFVWVCVCLGVCLFGSVFVWFWGLEPERAPFTGKIALSIRLSYENPDLFLFGFGGLRVWSWVWVWGSKG